MTDQYKIKPVRDLRPVHRSDSEGGSFGVGGKLKLFFLPFLFFFSNSFAQTTFQKTYGGTNSDYGYSVQQTTDGGYIITGFTKSFGVGGADAYLIKTDGNGDTLWTKVYGGTDYDYIYSVQQTADGGYIIAGATWSFGAGLYDEVYLIKTDVSGNYLWAKAYGGTNNDGGNSVQQTTDGGYIVTGFSKSLGASRIFLLKTDSSGDTLWTKTYIGVADETNPSVQQTADGGYIITSNTEILGAGLRDGYLIKTNSNGSILWTKTYGGTDYDYIYSVQQTTDGGYIITGYTESFGAGQSDVYLIKTDSIGDTLWTKTYGGTDYDYGRSVQQTSDGGYIIMGKTYSFGTVGQNIYLLKTDASGNILWARTYEGENNGYGSSVQQTSDGGYIIVGSTWNFGAGNSDVCLIKTDANGNIECITPTTTNTQVGSSSTIVGSGGGTVYNAAPIVNNTATIVSNTTTVVTDIFPVLPQPICLITVDSTSTKNVIVWEKPVTTGIDSFKIYRDIVGIYTHIGSVHYDSLSIFEDNTFGINPQVTSYRYKLIVVDTCGNESALSDFHKTIHLQVSPGIPPVINLSWDDYEGFSFTYYRILRDSTGLGNWEVIDSVSSGILSWTDANPPQTPDLRHMIEVVPPNVCIATKQKNWNSSKSNTSTSVTGINEYSSTNNQLKVYPNPNTGEFVIEFLVPNRVEKLQIKITNALGKTIYREELKRFTGLYQQSVDIKEYATGIYELQLISDKETTNKIIIIE